MPWKLPLSEICSFAMWRVNEGHWKTKICHFFSTIWIQKIKVQTSKTWQKSQVQLEGFSVVFRPGLLLQSLSSVAFSKTGKNIQRQQMKVSTHSRCHFGRGLAAEAALLLLVPHAAVGPPMRYCRAFSPSKKGFSLFKWFPRFVSILALVTFEP